MKKNRLIMIAAMVVTLFSTGAYAVSDEGAIWFCRTFLHINIQPLIDVDMEENVLQDFLEGEFGVAPKAPPIIIV